MNPADRKLLEDLDNKLTFTQPPRPKKDVSSTPTAPLPEAETTTPKAPIIGPQEAPRKTVDEVWEDFNKSPLFMTELEENDDIAALQALAYEGTPFDNASDFKERGNECFAEKNPRDAVEYYSKGVNILWHEERKRRPGEVTIGQTEGVPATEEEIAQQKKVLEALYINRAASHLELGNYRSCWLDCAAALRLNPKNVKAWYRSAKALLKVDRIEEADDACARGLALDPDNKALRGVADDIIKRNEFVQKRKKLQEAREASERRKKEVLAAAIKARGVRMRKTDKPPEMEDARVKLVPDEEDPRSTLVFPTMLFYPLHFETDFIKAFNEQETLGDHLSYVFPLPWDTKGEYTAAKVECYVETVTGGLIKIGKKLPLLNVLGGGKVEVVDQVVKIFVVPKAGAEGWVKTFKEQKAKAAAKS
ncbi:related to hsp90 chaperone complex associated protein CNS1 [Cephalotrichum gorgonifer]|uniref:Related to hsp90 chaperone complex associated protein CNS1 n=1 Tax=Cephalotrichum gorgonifer TaxID=2041049 RepID=A0AAE8MQZ4_9PEZI|nr:related to hsp90 chaperone complex associated protein CNS1 [Cephalotrichum gorgonifer]